jgi:hypothetical protein
MSATLTARHTRSNAFEISRCVKTKFVDIFLLNEKTTKTCQVKCVRNLQVCSTMFFGVDKFILFFWSFCTKDASEISRGTGQNTSG